MKNKKIRSNKKAFSPNSFLMKQLYEPILWRDGEKKRRKKVSQDDFEVPEYSDYNSLKTTNYNATERISKLKDIEDKLTSDLSAQIASEIILNFTRKSNNIIQIITINNKIKEI